jgi:hypothetical protein
MSLWLGEKIHLKKKTVSTGFCQVAQVTGRLDGLTGFDLFFCSCQFFTLFGSVQPPG